MNEFGSSASLPVSSSCVPEPEPLPRAAEPKLTAADWQDYEEGFSLFNAGRYWDAHEVWERLWRRSIDPDRLPARPFVQGLIQLAAACHLLAGSRRIAGGCKNLDKAEDKLRRFPAKFLRIDVAALLRAITDLRERIAACAGRPVGLAVDQLPQIALAPPGAAS